MGCAHIAELPCAEFSRRLHEQAAAARLPINGTLELTFRCNLACGHCYCNLPAHDHGALAREMDTGLPTRIIDQLAAAGCLWLLLTLFTNATLLTPEIVSFLGDWPPFSVEVSIYGATEPTCAALTGRSGGPCQVPARYQQPARPRHSRQAQDHGHHA